MPEFSPPPRIVYGVLLAVLLGIVGAVAYRRAAENKYDFHYFYRDASYVWQHGALNPDLPDLSAAMDGETNRWRRQLPFYLPVVPLLLAPLTAFGILPAAAAWAGMHVVALWCSVRILVRWGGGEPRGVEANASRDRLPNRAFGSLAGTRIVTLATMLAFAPCLAVFGPQRTAEYHLDWLTFNAHGLGGGQSDATLRAHFTDYHNQSISAVVARLCRPDHPYRTAWQPLHLIREQCATVSGGLAAVLAVALCWLSRRRLRSLELHTARCEAAAFAIAMLVFAPLLRQYYLIWALPALVILVRAALGGDDATAARRLGIAGIAVWLLGMLLWLSPSARSCGAHLLLLIVVGTLVLRNGVTRSAPPSQIAAAEESTS